MANSGGKERFWRPDLYATVESFDGDAGHPVGAVEVEQKLAIMAPNGLRAATSETWYFAPGRGKRVNRSPNGQTGLTGRRANRSAPG